MGAPSTSQPSQIGEDQSSNEGWRLAVGGEIVNELTHRDEFNGALTASSRTAMCWQAISPSVAATMRPVEAVFEPYGDVTELNWELDDVQLRRW